ncbi:MAG: hypothetical protein ACRDI2_12685, partial [Chloroflexota bacterium]
MPGKPTDVHPRHASLYFLPVQTRVPLKFGAETLTHVTCARVALEVEDAAGKRATGWGETPLSVQWVWPSALPYEERHAALKAFTGELAGAWAAFSERGHPIEVGHAFLADRLPSLLARFNQQRAGAEPMPWLAALVCCSAFDLALHDAYGVLHSVPVYSTYTAAWMNSDLTHFLIPAEEGTRHSPLATRNPFTGKYPTDFLVTPPPTSLPAWHLVGGKDPLDAAELDGTEPDDGYPVLLRDWIRRDGLTCLKVKLRGNDTPWDYDHLVKVGQIAVAEGVSWLSSDFNCTVTDPAYVDAILDRLMI